MKHEHQFVAAGQIEKSVNTNGYTPMRTVPGTAYVCLDPECRELRNVYVDGVVFIAVKGLDEVK